MSLPDSHTLIEPTIWTETNYGVNTSVADANGTRSVRGLVRQMQLLVKRTRRSILYDLQQYDHLHHGRVTPAQFRSVLNSQGMAALNDAELALFLVEFAHPRDRTRIDYVRFIKVVDRLITHPWSAMDVADVPVLDTDREPARDLGPDGEDSDPRAPRVNSDGVMRPGLSPDDVRRVERCLERLQKAVRCQRIEYRTFFYAHDSLRSGYISPTKFASVLGQIGLAGSVVSPGDVALIAQYFAHSVTHVDYRQFCRAVETHRY